MKPEQLARLEELAREATSGVWSAEQGWVGSPPMRSDRIWSGYPGPFRMVADGMRPTDAEFIAAARPAVVLELIRQARPERGNDAAAWLKACRDGWPRNSAEWRALDGVLDGYRLAADTGTPLGGEVEHGCA
jgi:hypothetical protein